MQNNVLNNRCVVMVGTCLLSYARTSHLCASIRNFEETHAHMVHFIQIIIYINFELIVYGLIKVHCNNIISI